MRRLAIGRSIADVLGLTDAPPPSASPLVPAITCSRHHIEVTSFGNAGAVYLPAPAWDVSLRVAEFDMTRFFDFYAIDVTLGKRRYRGTMWIRAAESVTAADGSLWWQLTGEAQDLTVSPP